MFFGKWLNIQIPFVLQRAIDNVSKAKAAHSASELLASPLFYQSSALSLLVYGVSRALSVVCSEIKTCLFAHVSQNVLRRFSNDIFQHLHSLDHDFHIATPSGVISVAYARAVRGFQTTLFQIVFSVVPTLLELLMVSHVLHKRFGSAFSTVTIVTFSTYLAFTVWITQWRVSVRKELVDVDNQRNGFFIDSILNQEVIKLFTAEERESRRFDGYLRQQEQLSITNTYAIAVLNLGQALLFCGGLTASLVLALNRVLAGTMSVGDLVAVNSMLLQLSIPFNFIGFTYQELRQAFVDMGYMRGVLTSVQPSVVDENAGVSFADVQQRQPLQQLSGDYVAAEGELRSSVEFRNVTLRYRPEESAAAKVLKVAAEADAGGFGSGGVKGVGVSKATTGAAAGNNSAAGAAAAAAAAADDSLLLKGVSFTILPGQSCAIVGPSGSGKSTALRLITRMLDATSGSVLVDGVDTRAVSLQALRARVAVVPQDTSLFDDTIEHNIRYGNPTATAEQVSEALRQCNLAPTIAKFPDGLQTRVGERGQRLSGGERQKVSIARALLKSPSLILCDEVTSAVDAFAERDIVETLRKAANKRTTLTIAHRLSSIVHCDKILVLEGGRLVQQGTHSELLRDCNGTYARMWTAQQGDAWMEGQECIVEDVTAAGLGQLGGDYALSGGGAAAPAGEEQDVLAAAAAGAG